MNLVPALVDLRAKEVRLEADSSSLLSNLECELRVGEASVSTDKMYAQVKARRLSLNLELEGLEVVAGSRFGDPIKDNMVVVKATSTVEHISSNKKAADCDAKLGVKERNVSIGAAGHVASENKVTSRADLKEEIYHFRVKAKPNDVWQVAEYNNESLSGTYLAQENLCKLEPVHGANRRRIALSVEVRQKDLEFDVDRRGVVNIPQTKEKLIQIFLAKHCLNRSGEYNGIIRLSDVEISDEN